MVGVERKRILVADDTLPMRIMLHDVLTEAGYDVITADDGEEAWNFISKDEKFDLIILDLLMPRMTGFDILERLGQNSRPMVKVLVITGSFKSPKEIRRLRDLGACGYLTKSAPVDEILFRVNQVFHIGLGNTRKRPRLLMSVPISYRVQEEQFVNYTSNFSADGAFIRTIDPAPPNAQLDLIIKIPGREGSIEASGRVVWTNEYETYRRKSCLPGMGIEFLELNPQYQKILSEFITNKLVNEPVWLE